MKIYINTIGCKLNQFETQAMSEQLAQDGHTVVESMAECEAVVVNSCTVTSKADARSRQVMRKAKKAGKYVVATGCYATTDFELLREFDYIDLVVQNDNKFQISRFLEDAQFIPDPVQQGTEFPLVSSFERTRAFVKIQDGCDRFCSYCKIPAARGRSRSFSLESILAQVQRLIDNGYKEIVLTGVNISDYHAGDITLSGLIADILDIEGEYRLRLSSIQPDQFEDRLLQFLDHPRFTRHFHLSLQSGSASVLKRMNRHYVPADFESLVERIRAQAPDCGVTTDIILGFPGETEQEFQETVDFCQKIGFSRLHVFPYSPREGTRAAAMPDMAMEIKKSRERVLLNVALDSATRFAREQLMDKEHLILVETWQEKGWSGYTSNYIKMNSSTPGLRENSFATLKARNFSVSEDAVIELFDH